MVYSTSIEEHWKHLNKFVQTIKENGLSLFTTKINLFQTKIRFLGHHIYQGTITPIQSSIQFANKFPEFQRFLESLNYVSKFLKDISQLCAPLRETLKNNLAP